jgi:hypothetical protein
MWFEKQSRGLRCFALLALYAIEIILIELFAGLAGCLSAVTVTCTAAIVLLVTGVVRLYASGRKPSIRFSRQGCLILLLLLLIGFGFGVFLGRYIIQGTRFCHDDLTYHATVTAHWYLEKDISAGPMNYHYYVPMNAELLSLWYLLPFGQDGAVFLAGFYWLCLAVAAGAVLFERMNLSLKWLGFFPLLFCCSKDIYWQAFTTFSAVDFAGPVMVLSALAFLACIPRDSTIQRWPYILLAGLCGGFAFGTKVPFLTVCFILGVWLFFSLPGRLSIRLGYVCLFGLAALVAGSFWYVRDLILSGNPVFPGQLGPLGGPLTRDIQYQTSVIGRLVQSGFNRDIIRDLIIAHVSWPYGIFLVSLAGIIAGVYRFVCPDGRRRTIVLILIAVFVMIATYPLMPFSAANNDPNSPLIINLRFVIGPFLLGILLFFLLLEGTSRYRMVWLLLGCAGVVISYIRHSNPTMLPLSAGAFLWYWIYPVVQERGRFVSPYWLCVFILAILGGLAVVYPHLQQKADENILSNLAFRRETTQAWEKIDSLPPASRITAAGYQSYCYYPFFGRHYQNQPWTFSYGYNSFVPLHVRWKNNPDQTVFWKSSHFSPEQWLQAFSSVGGEYLLVYRSPDGNWPQAQEILTRLYIADQVDSGDGWVIWKVKK